LASSAINAYSLDCDVILSQVLILFLRHQEKERTLATD